MTPEQQARKVLEELLAKAGWHNYENKTANILAVRGDSIRESLINPRHGESDYLLFLRRYAARQPARRI